MEIYKGNGESGRVYYVFPPATNYRTAIKEAARAGKNGVSKMTTIPVWIKGDDLFLEKTKGARKTIAVVKRGIR